MGHHQAITHWLPQSSLYIIYDNRLPGPFTLKIYKFCLKNAGPLGGGMVIEGTFLDLLRDPTNCMACDWATENSIETGVSFSS